MNCKKKKKKIQNLLFKKKFNFLLSESESNKILHFQHLIVKTRIL